MKAPSIELVSIGYLSRVFHVLPDHLRERLTALGIDPVERRDGVPYYPAAVADQLRVALAERRGRRGGHVGDMA